MTNKEQIDLIIDYYHDNHVTEFKDGEQVGAMVTRHLKRLTDAVDLALAELEAAPSEAYPYPSAVKKAMAILKEARRPALPPTVAEDRHDGAVLARGPLPAEIREADERR